MILVFSGQSHGPESWSPFRGAGPSAAGGVVVGQALAWLGSPVRSREGPFRQVRQKAPLPPQVDRGGGSPGARTGRAFRCPLCGMIALGPLPSPRGLVLSPCKGT